MLSLPLPPLGHQPRAERANRKNANLFCLFHEKEVLPGLYSKALHQLTLLKHCFRFQLAILFLTLILHIHVDLHAHKVWTCINVYCNCQTVQSSSMDQHMIGCGCFQGLLCFLGLIMCAEKILTYSQDAFCNVSLKNN